MALLTPSPIVQSVRGKVGHLAYQGSPQGQRVAPKSRPRAPLTDAQVVHKGRVSLATAAWGTLSLAERQTWIAYAAATPYTSPDGRTIKLSAYNYFLKLAILRLQAGLATLRVAPPIGESLPVWSLATIALWNDNWPAGRTDLPPYDAYYILPTLPADWLDAYPAALYLYSTHHRPKTQPSLRGGYRLMYAITATTYEIFQYPWGVTPLDPPIPAGRLIDVVWRGMDSLGRLTPWSHRRLDTDVDVIRLPQ